MFIAARNWLLMAVVHPGTRATWECKKRRGRHRLAKPRSSSSAGEDDTLLSTTAATSQWINDVTQGIFMTFYINYQSYLYIYWTTTLSNKDRIICIILIIERKPGKLSFGVRKKLSYPHISGKGDEYIIGCCGWSQVVCLYVFSKSMYI